MGYGSSLPMSGYYHQMGPMSQVDMIRMFKGFVTVIYFDESAQLLIIGAEVDYAIHVLAYTDQWQTMISELPSWF